ncbi:hypothetical protein ASPZODRAFT_148552 [Penicilliopsis zonata CBS 506.65]|uniref:Multifunctional fusion protein n=1 Tax=Penicilliopsis zonata CBS 506.65 TaxID=1073090 RepID=A0A1L9SVU6_9EURO|nr:hypothetical protein ASPZODRAFT_148552 [Penicilliopsis zonata CBS 506.65]OJJ51231.1 hypothetical protein ASPZODRAFT_148552 [Penicilliopsis zonata CBS 506.65]
MQQQTRYSPSMEGGQMNPTIIPGRRRKQAFFWRSGKKIPWVTYLMTTIQIAVFIAELVRNAQLTGTPIEIHPSFNPMIGPSPYVQIYMGSRFVPCMKNINGVQNANETVYWNCPNTTTSDSSAASNHCTLSELCGFDGVPNPHPGGSLSDRPEPNQWFRFIIPMFIHAGFIHIGFNLLTQLTVGSAMERLIGWWRYAIVYLASGIFGFVMGGNYAAQGISSCGCSGCLFGILALELLDLLYTWKQRPSPWVELVIMLVGVAVSFFLGLLPGLDNFSHIGGFLMGLALGLCLMRSPSSLQERIGLAGNPYVAMSGGAGPGASDDDNNSTNNNGNNNNNNNRNANKATRPATSITDFLKGRRAPEGPSSLLDVFRGRKPLWWAWWLVRIGSLVAILIGFILLIVDFYKYASSTCSWCYRLSCLVIGLPSTFAGVVLYLLLNASYSVAVFTDPGSPANPRSNTSRHEYSALPVTEMPASTAYTAYTVNSAGGSRFCKKCQCPKPDRAHHCSTCKRCVLKMDHHCPWLATCVGLHNYKAFLLFLIYTSVFCWVCFFVSAGWIWHEVFGPDDSGTLDNFLPIGVVLLSILSGIIGLVLSGFTVWHISLALRGMTTIECLEKTRYVSPLRKALNSHRFDTSHGNHNNPAEQEGLAHRLQEYGNQILDAHANAIPGVTRAEEGEERASPVPTSNPSTLSPAQQALSRSYVDLERQRETDRYHDYLEEQDNEKLPSAFDLGWRGNLAHLFGPRPLLWWLPVCTTTGDGWHWEASRRFLEAREQIRRNREQELASEREYYRDLYQRNLNNSRSWGSNHSRNSSSNNNNNNNHQSVAVGIPGRTLDVSSDPERPATGVSMKTLRPMSPRPRPGESDYSDNDEEFEQTEHSAARIQGSDEWRDWD